MPVSIETDRFHLRELMEADVSDRYLGWLKDADAERFIVSARQTTDLPHLKDYVRSKAGRDDVLFLGIFDKSTGVHIGNLKYEPVDSEKGYAIMGILIGDAAYRGKGVAPEVLTASGAWLKAHRRIVQVALGVHAENVAAITAYERVGFRRNKTPFLPEPSGTLVTMVWAL